MHLRCRLTKNSPRRTASTPAGVFCTLLASTSPIFKSAGSAAPPRMAGIPFVAAHKLFLNGKSCSTNSMKGAFHTILPLYGCRFSEVFHTDLLRVFLSNL